MEFTFKLELDSFLINQNNSTKLDTKKYILSSKMVLENFDISFNYDKYDKEIEKTLNNHNEKSICHIYCGDDVDNYYFRIDEKYCLLHLYLEKEKLLKLHEQLLLDEHRFETKLQIDITITDTEEIIKDEYGFQLKISELVFMTKSIRE